MLTHIRTSKENKEVVTKLTSKLNLGAENIIARWALGFSLARENKLNLSTLQDSSGKEYSGNVLFGDYQSVYVGIICNRYRLSASDRNIHKYVKLHLDDGLSAMNESFNDSNNFDVIGFMDFLINMNKYA